METIYFTLLILLYETKHNVKCEKVSGSSKGKNN